MFVVAALLVPLASVGLVTTASAPAQATTVQTQAIVEAATAFEATLTSAQVETLTYDFSDSTKTTSWSNFPVTQVARAGVQLQDLTVAQQAAAMAVMESLLSEAGYAKVTQIMEADQVLVDTYGAGCACGNKRYYLAFFGAPSTTEAWEIQFGGHHIGINATIRGADVTVAPTHTGAQPAIYTENGTTYEPLGSEVTDAFAFYDSLTTAQRSTLYQGTSVSDLTCAPGKSCSYPTGTGIQGAELTDAQKQLLLAVIANWSGLAKDDTAQLAAIAATLDTTYVQWRGSTVDDRTSATQRYDGIYFQISGPRVYLEFSNQQQGGDTSGANLLVGWQHIHSIYRDPANDYGTSSSAGATTTTVPATSTVPATTALAATTTELSVAKRVGSGSRAKVQVEVTAASTTPTGQVSLLVDEEIVATKALSSGSARFRLPRHLAKGKHMVRALYLGGTTTATSSAASTIKVLRASAISVTLAQRTVGVTERPVVLVTSSGSTVLSGTVVVTDVSNGDRLIAKNKMTKTSVLRLVLRRLAVGVHRLRVRYSGSPSVAGSQDEVTLRVRAS